MLHGLDEATLLDILDGVPQFKIARSDIEAGINFVDLTAERAAVFPSKGETRKLIQGGGVSLNKEKVADPAQKVTAADLIAGKYLLVQKGKKNYYLIIVQ
jgi:tyrosyl-tRNA synthetase